MTDGTLILLISIGAIACFVLGVPIFLIIGLWVVCASFVLDLTLNNIGVALSDVFTDGFALLAMPLFILTGDLIYKSGIALRLSAFAYSCLGWLRGGLALASLGACGLFTAISGSNSATAATIGSIMHPEMVKGGYKSRFAAATEAAGVTVGFCVIVGLISLPLHRIIGAKGEDAPIEERSFCEMLVVKGFRVTEVPSIVMRSAQITGILAPILAPIAHTMGVDPIHFAVVFLIGDAIGFITPPYGLNLYVASGVTGIPYLKLLRYTLPYLLSLLAVWIVVALVPELSTMLLPQRGG
jgi:TRAP-type C4-dicarboxylate transport system permease large subunit